MSKQFVFRIGWQHYTLDDPEKAAKLLALLAQLTRVKQKGYSGPYYLDSDTDPVCSGLIVEEVILTPPPVDDEESAVEMPVKKDDSIPF